MKERKIKGNDGSSNLTADLYPQKIQCGRYHVGEPAVLFYLSCLKNGEKFFEKYFEKTSSYEKYSPFTIVSGNFGILKKFFGKTLSFEKKFSINF